MNDTRPRRNPVGRREAVRSIARWSIALASGGLLAALGSRRGACSQAPTCGSCPTFGACDLPRSEAYRAGQRRAR